MAKAINWPRQFREEVLAEDCNKVFCALRLGSLYYDGRFWSDQEEVDIRVNHLKVRKGVVQGDLKCCPVKDLSPDDLSKLKAPLQNVPALVEFLSKNYGKPVDENSPVTVVYYKNLPVVPDEVEQQDDPHM